MSKDVFLNVWDSPWDNVQASNHADPSTTPTTPSSSSSIGAYDVYITGHDNHNDDITIDTAGDVGINDVMVKDQPLTPPKDIENNKSPVLDEAEANNGLDDATLHEPAPKNELRSFDLEKQETDQVQSHPQFSKELDQTCSTHSTDNDDDDENTEQSQKLNDPDPLVENEKSKPTHEHGNAMETSIAQVSSYIGDGKDADEAENSIKNKNNENPVAEVGDNDEGADDDDDFGDFEVESEPLPAKPKGPLFKVPITTLLASITAPSTPNDSIANPTAENGNNNANYKIENTSIESILNINHARKYKNLLTRPTRQFLHADDLPNSTIIHLSRRCGHRHTMSMSSAGTANERLPVQSNIEIEARKILLELRRSEKPKFNFSWRQTQRFSLPAGQPDRSSSSLPSSPVATSAATMLENHFNADSKSNKAGTRSSMIILPTKKQEDDDVSSVSQAASTKISRASSPSIVSSVSKSSTGNSFPLPTVAKIVSSGSSINKPLTINTVQTATVNAAIAASIVGAVHKSPLSGRKNSVSSSRRKSIIGSLSSISTSIGALGSLGSSSKVVHSVASAVKPKLSIMEPLTPTTPVLPSVPTRAGGIFKSTPALHVTPVVLNSTHAVSDSPTVTSMPFGSTPTSLAESTNGNSHSSADNDDYDDDDDDWGDFVSEASPTSEFGPGLKTGSKPAAVVPNAPVIPASATFAPSPPLPPPPVVKLSLGPLQPTIKSKTTLESDKVAAIIAALPDLSFMLDG